MMPSRDHLDRFQEMPRVTRWIVMATIFLVVFLCWAKLVQPTAQAWSEEADTMELHLDRLRGNNSVPSDIRDAAISFGTLKLPDRKQQGSLELVQNIQEVLQSHGIKNDSFRLGRPTPINAAKSAGLTRGNEKLERLKGDLDFVATPNVAIKIISELESNPAIEAISMVKLDTHEARTLKVRLTIESWVRAGSGVRR